MKKQIYALLALSLSFAASYGQQTEVKAAPSTSSTLSTLSTSSGPGLKSEFPAPQIIYVYTTCPCMPGAGANVHFMQTLPVRIDGPMGNFQFAPPPAGVPGMGRVMINPAGPGLYEAIPLKEKDNENSRKKKE